tara:strand:+ start:195 stop:572 length:378 start_codon:yes stop_codon:yes gene_type:complete
MKIILCFLSIITILYITSCQQEDSPHGCFDSEATNYDNQAVIDNNSCCYDCFYFFMSSFDGEMFYGNACGNEVDELETNGFQEISQQHVNSVGDVVAPFSPGAIASFDASGNPQMFTYNYSVDCN